MLGNNKVQVPLAEEMRPQILEQYVGQEHLKVKIDSLIKGKRLPSMLLFGPPGCGKSSLALLLAKSHNLPVLRVSAPEAGLTQLRKLLKEGTCLILDELHRFSKAQQDFFLPILEAGTITLIATTTENPSFCITKQLLSRLHILKLKALSPAELLELGKKTLAHKNQVLPEDILKLLCTISYGDGRMILNLLELIQELPEEKLNIESIKELLPDIIARHDKKGDSHYELISAMIKSIRGSDPDASLYYLAALLEGGEDPRFICRRLILSASEDVGLADPYALSLAVACHTAVENIGMPEGYIPMAETVVYLALAPKSNSAYTGYFKASQEIKTNGVQPVPLHLRNASTALQKEWNYGKGYLYSHNYPQGYVEQEYLPETLTQKKFYQGKAYGREGELLRQHLEKIKNSAK